jgi:integrase
MADTRLRKRGTKNGRDVWTAVVPLPKGGDGRRRQHRFSFVGNKTEAHKALLAELSGIETGGFVAPERTSLGEYLRDWLASSGPGYSGRTFQRFEAVIRCHLIPALGDVPLQRLTAMHLNRAYGTWRQQGRLCEQSILHNHRLLHRILAQAAREGRVRQNVASNAEKPRPAARELRIPTADQIERLMRAVPGTSFDPLVLLAVATGARLGELVGLRWSDIDFERGMLTIRRALEYSKAYGLREKAPKSGKARGIDLPASAVELLRRHRKATADDACPYVIQCPSGGPWNPQRASNAFRKLADRENLPIHFHLLRHYAASQLMALGLSAKVVQERLGHATAGFTLNVYGHLGPSLQAEAARRLDDVLAPLISRSA